MLRDSNTIHSFISSALIECSALGTGKSAINDIAFMELLVCAQQDIVGWRLSNGDLMGVCNRETWLSVWCVYVCVLVTWVFVCW